MSNEKPKKPEEKSMDDIEGSIEDLISKFSHLAAPGPSPEQIAAEERESEERLKAVSELQDDIKGEELAKKIPGIEEEGYEWRADYEKIDEINAEKKAKKAEAALEASRTDKNIEEQGIKTVPPAKLRKPTEE